MEIDEANFKQATDEIREIMNWIAVFEVEYKLPNEVVCQLRERLEKVASLLGAGTIE